MREVTAKCPGHLTGIFQICDEPEDPLLKGSRGAGVSITHGVTTKVKVERAPRSHFKIRINGVPTTDAIVSEHVLRTLLQHTTSDYNIEVDHKLEVPMGAGFGSSGGGALSLALALNEALNLGLSRVEAAQVAHISEVECKTGLGTVVGEAHGGFGIRVKPGGPGIGKIEWIPLPRDYVVVCLSFGPLSTRNILTNEDTRKRINTAGGVLLEKLIQNPSPKYFMELSRKFTEYVGLVSKKVDKVLKEAESLDLPCTMAMLGESIFSLVYRETAEEILELFRRHASRGDFLIVSEVDNEGARILE